MEDYSDFVTSDNSTNHDDDHDHDSPALITISVIAAVIIVLFDVLIVVCNVFMLAVLRHPHIEDIGEVNIFLFRIMAIVDIFGGCASTTFQLYSEPSFFVDHAEPSSEVCLLLLFFCFYTANLSIWLQCLITTNKYLMVTHPLRYPNLVTVKRFAVTLSICVLLSLNCATFLPIPSFPYTSRGLFFCRDGIFDNPSLSVDLGILVACIACPALITSLLNVRLLAVSISHSRKVLAQDAISSNETPSDNVLGNRRGPRFRGIKTIILLVITSYFYVIFSALFVAVHPLLVTEILHAIIGNLLYLMSLSSFWWKLFVLIMTNGRFRSVSKKVWSDFRGICTRI
ncbi:uncharacterized protein LOC121412267 [Lytechinus variegatus]|uniref:uncharacterized protein LOC121412267 n=1 Tax=Lytechinus variegatus TaxID=7654 RepID=UPI001BB0F529|nr:uncharacterized protein LOC121412267 [Lytechinus variegatus]